MKLNNLTPAAGSKGREKRIGRGEGSGHGGTSTRGHKGAQARSGYSRKIGFEGGQMPIQRRLPKFGFTNPTRVEYKGINVATLQTLAEANTLQCLISVFHSNLLPVFMLDFMHFLGKNHIVFTAKSSEQCSQS